MPAYLNPFRFGPPHLSPTHWSQSHANRDDSTQAWSASSPYPPSGNNKCLRRTSQKKNCTSATCLSTAAEPCATNLSPSTLANELWHNAPRHDGIVACGTSTTHGGWDTRPADHSFHIGESPSVDGFLNGYATVVGLTSSCRHGRPNW